MSRVSAQNGKLVPGEPELPDRLHAVLGVVYLIFNEGYAASSGNRLIRDELCFAPTCCAAWAATRTRPLRMKRRWH